MIENVRSRERLSCGFSDVFYDWDWRWLGREGGSVLVDNGQVGICREELGTYFMNQAVSDGLLRIERRSIIHVTLPRRQ